MPDSRIAELLHGLGSREPRPAWDSFLEIYSALIYQVVRWFERDADESADCFLYVCEHLSRNAFRRLRRFHPDGRASFPTWLRAVVRNLCLDWHRRRHGRFRVFRSVAQLPDFDRQVFHHVCEQGLSSEECAAALQSDFTSVNPEQVAASVQRLRRSLSPRQFWLLNVRRNRTEPLSLDAGSERSCTCREVPDPAPDPEIQAALRESRDGLQRALAKLSPGERLLLQLRFEQEMTLVEVARMLSLKDAQTADRRIRDALARVREYLGMEPRTSGKTEVKSV